MFTAYLTDVGSGIDPVSIVMALDGTDLTGFVFDPTTGVLTYRVPTVSPLSSTSHRLTVDCADLAGNVAEQAVSSFRIALPRIAAGLHMMSIPFGNLLDTRPSAIFSLPQEKVTVVRWLPTDTRRDDKYHWWGGPTGIEDQYASFEPLDATSEPPFVVSEPPAGLGYFLKLDADATLNVAGTSLSDQVRYDIVLSYGYTTPRGWNMVGCPFLDAVSWGGVQFITNGTRQDLRDAIDDGVTDGVLFELKYTSSEGYFYDFPGDPLAGSLQPWKGYWLHVLKDTTLVLYNSVITSGDKPVALKAEKPGPPTANEWVLRFGASVAGGCDPTNYVGVAPGAGDGYDVAHDVGEPPALASPVRVYLRHSDWGERSGRYAKDMRGALGAGQTWEVTVACDRPNADVTITWPELNATVPADVRLMLTDADAGRDVYMRTTSGYTYRTGDEPSVRQLRIVATPAAGGGLMLTNVASAQAADGTVQLTYTVNTASEVSAEILNIAGRCIKRLGSQSAAPNTIESAVWNCRNTGGARVPAGRYIMRLTARTETGEAAQAVRAFQVRR
jgi:hypothetical protein